MSDYLSNFIEEDNGPSRPSGLNFIDRAAKPKVPALKPPAPSGAGSSKAKSESVDKKFLNKDDSIHVTYTPKGGAPEEIIVPRLQKKFTTVLNQSTILYGPSKTGKTVLTHDFMFIMRKVFPFVFVFAPTNEENHDYDGIVPAPLIYEKFGLNEIKNIYLRQKAAASMYRTANALPILHKMFLRVATPNAKLFLKKITALQEKALQEAESKCSSLAEKKDKRKEITEMFEEKLIRFYKQIINPNAKRLENMNLDEKEKYALRYRNFNPRILVIFDDAMTEIMKLIREGKKKDDEVIKNFFFKGRHCFITHMYTFQDDCKLDSDIRKNAFFSMFTSKQVALSFFQRTANSFATQEKKRAEAIINEVFTEENERRHVKLVYARNDRHKFYYVIGDEHEDFEMCAHIVRDFCEKVCAKGSNFDTSNPFFKQFTDRV
jgi:hypothetical protein